MISTFLLERSKKLHRLQIKQGIYSECCIGNLLIKCTSSNFAVGRRAMAKSNQWNSRKAYTTHCAESIIKLRFCNIAAIWITATGICFAWNAHLPNSKTFHVFTGQCQIRPYFIEKSIHHVNWTEHMLEGSQKGQPITVPNYIEIEHVRGETPSQKDVFFCPIFSLSIEHNKFKQLEIDYPRFTSIQVHHREIPQSPKNKKQKKNVNSSIRNQRSTDKLSQFHWETT